MRNGGSKKTESAVDWALWWLANHQEADGHWDVGKYEGKAELENDVDSTGAGSSMQAIAMLVRQYFGWHRAEPWLTAAANGQVTHLPNPNGVRIPIYRVYYSYLAMFQQGGKEWNTWNEAVTPIVLKQQRQDGDFKGSWDPAKGHVHVGGHVLSTTFLALSLEIYYRYQSVMK